MCRNSACWELAIANFPPAAHAGHWQCWLKHELAAEREGGRDQAGPHAGFIFTRRKGGRAKKKEGKSDAGVWLDSSCHTLHHLLVSPKGHHLANATEMSPTLPLQPLLPWGTIYLKKAIFTFQVLCRTNASMSSHCWHLAP